MEIQTENDTTFGICGHPETDNIFWVDMSVHIHIPDNILTWALQIINSSVELFATWMTLLGSRLEKFDTSQYDTTKYHISLSIFVNIAITHTDRKHKSS